MGISECHLLPCRAAEACVGGWERCLMFWQLPPVPITALVAHVATRNHITSTGLARLVGPGEVKTSPRHDSGWLWPLLEAKMGKFPNTELWGNEGALGTGFWRCMKAGEQWLSE